MTDLSKYRNKFIPVKYFLNCYRALSDGRSGVRHLETLINSDQFFLSDWKVSWVGACAILRTSITLFQVDSKSCIDPSLRREIKNEWQMIADKKDSHPIFWEFLRKERDNIIHEYEWGAYEVWIGADGALSRPKVSLLQVRPNDVRSVLLMRGGHYAGRNSLEVLTESASWIQDRIYSAIRRAGYEPEKLRNIATFQKRPTLLDTIKTGTLEK